MSEDLQTLQRRKRRLVSARENDECAPNPSAVLDEVRRRSWAEVSKSERGDKDDRVPTTTGVGGAVESNTSRQIREEVCVAGDKGAKASLEGFTLMSGRGCLPSFAHVGQDRTGQVSPSHSGRLCANDLVEPSGFGASDAAKRTAPPSSRRRTVPGAVAAEQDTHLPLLHFLEEPRVTPWLGLQAGLTSLRRRGTQTRGTDFWDARLLR